MTWLHTLGFYIHIIAGSAALMLVWIPLTVKKGSMDHKRFGRYYHQVMMTVAMSGAFIATLVIIDPLMIHGSKLSTTSDPAVFVDRMRVFFSLLLYLSLIIYVGLSQGEKALLCKKDNSVVKNWQHLAPNYLLVFASAPLFIAGWLNDMTLAMIFPFLGIALGVSHIRFSRQSSVTVHQWLQQHIGAYIGTAIGAYTAFLAFGGRTIFSDIGQWQLLFWIMPGVIGNFIIRHFIIKYAPRTDREQKQQV